MPTPLPYVIAYGKIKTLFEKVASAKVPDAFTQNYLHDTLGMTSSGDRPLIPLMRALGFIDSAGKPSPDYASLKNSQRTPAVIAQGVKRAYAPLFASNENAHKLSGEELRGLVAQVTGAEEEITKRTAGTFKTLVELSDTKVLDGATPPPADAQDNSKDKQKDEKGDDEKRDTSAEELLAAQLVRKSPIRPEFHYNIQVHLPSNGTEETYLNIFNALRKALS